MWQGFKNSELYYECASHERVCHPEVFHFWRPISSPISHLRSNKFNQLPSFASSCSAWSQFVSRYDASSMLMSKNVNNHVSKDRSIEYPSSGRRHALKAVLEERWRWRETSQCLSIFLVVHNTISGPSSHKTIINQGLTWPFDEKYSHDNSVALTGDGNIV